MPDDAIAQSRFVQRLCHGHPVEAARAWPAIRSTTKDTKEHEEKAGLTTDGTDALILSFSRTFNSF